MDVSISQITTRYWGNWVWSISFHKVTYMNELKNYNKFYTYERQYTGKRYDIHKKKKMCTILPGKKI